jgi:hypothetical protein
LHRGADRWRGHTIPAAAPEVDLSRVQRIWPVVLSAGAISQTEMLWDYVRGQSTGMLAQAKVQPVTLLDPQDFEQLTGLVEAGPDLSAILTGKSTEPYRDLGSRGTSTTLPGRPVSDHAPRRSRRCGERRSRKQTRCSTPRESYRLIRPTKTDNTALLLGSESVNAAAAYRDSAHCCQTPEHAVADRRHNAEASRSATQTSSPCSSNSEGPTVTGQRCSRYAVSLIASAIGPLVRRRD